MAHAAQSQRSRHRSGVEYLGVYARLSPKPHGKGYEGVADQEKWGRAYWAERRPGVPVRVYTDAGISAANGDHRPGYERLHHEILNGVPDDAESGAGHLGGLWTVEQSRIQRGERGEWFGFAADMDDAGLPELHTDRDGLIRVMDEVAGIKSVLAASERRKMLRRQADTLREIAARGVPPGSRPYGYAHAVDAAGHRTYVIVPEQAAVIREAADKILSGWSLSSIATELRGRGLVGAHRRHLKGPNGDPVVGPDGEPATRPTLITGQTVRGMVTNRAVVGDRVHQGQVVGPGNWPAILDGGTFKAVCNKLATPRTVHRSDGGSYPLNDKPVRTARRYLLTGGIAVCGVCGAPLVASAKQLRSKHKDPADRVVTTKPYYLCHPKVGGRGCVGIMGDELETHLAAALFTVLDKPGFLAAIAADDHSERRDTLITALEAVEVERNELARMWTNPGPDEEPLTAGEWQTARRGLADRERRLRAELAGIPPPPSGIDLSAVRQAWPDMTLDERRELIAMVAVHVTVHRAVPGRKGFDPGRVEIGWRA